MGVKFDITLHTDCGDLAARDVIYVGEWKIVYHVKTNLYDLGYFVDGEGYRRLLRDVDQRALREEMGAVHNIHPHTLVCPPTPDMLHFLNSSLQRALDRVDLFTDDEVDSDSIDSDYPYAFEE